MDFQIALFLVQDGLTNGAIYALMALSLVLVFSVTRVIFIPQGELLAFGTLTLAALEMGQFPGVVWLLCVLGATAFAFDLFSSSSGTRRGFLARSAGWNLALPALVAAICWWAATRDLSFPMHVALTFACVVPLGPMLYRVAYQPIAEASVLTLLIISVALHLALAGIGLLLFGAEGSRTPAFSSASFEIGALLVTGQSIAVYVCSIALAAALFIFFDRTIWGKALRATAINRVGARLSGISAEFAGKVSFLLAAVIAVFSGLLIGPITTIYYDTGFMIGLKGFVGAIIGGLASYPIGMAGALLVGLLEAFASFYASAYKEVIVFTLIIPVLLWRSARSRGVEE
jgi:branched-chain amino acid transport system permease protein